MSPLGVRSPSTNKIQQAWGSTADAHTVGSLSNALLRASSVQLKFLDEDTKAKIQESCRGRHGPQWTTAVRKVVGRGMRMPQCQNRKHVGQLYWCWTMLISSSLSLRQNSDATNFPVAVKELQLSYHSPETTYIYIHIMVT